MFERVANAIDLAESDFMHAQPENNLFKQKTLSTHSLIALKGAPSSPSVAPVNVRPQIKNGIQNGAPSQSPLQQNYVKALTRILFGSAVENVGQFFLETLTMSGGVLGPLKYDSSTAAILPHALKQELHIARQSWSQQAQQKWVLKIVEALEARAKLPIVSFDRHSDKPVLQATKKAFYEINAQEQARQNSLSKTRQNAANAGGNLPATEKVLQPSSSPSRPQEIQGPLAPQRPAYDAKPDQGILTASLQAYQQGRMGSYSVDQVGQAVSRLQAHNGIDAANAARVTDWQRAVQDFAQARSFIDKYQTYFQNYGGRNGLVGEAGLERWKTIAGTLQRAAGLFKNSPDVANYQKAFEKLSYLYQARVIVSGFVANGSYDHNQVNAAIAYLNKHDPALKNDGLKGGYRTFLDKVYQTSLARTQPAKSQASSQAIPSARPSVKPTAATLPAQSSVPVQTLPKAEAQPQEPIVFKFPVPEAIDQPATPEALLESAVGFYQLVYGQYRSAGQPHAQAAKLAVEDARQNLQKLVSSFAENNPGRAPDPAEAERSLLQLIAAIPEATYKKKTQ